jgi:lipoprotein-anchoring transpeptidase ErfK/SrfK
MPIDPVSRRRFLMGAAALISVPAAARAQGYPQYPPQAPYPGAREPFDVRPPGNVQPHPQQQPYPQQGQQSNPPEGQAEPPHTYNSNQPPEPPDGQNWYIGEIPDGRFRIPKVNQDLLNPDFRRQLVTYSHTEQPGSLIIDPRQHFLYLLREGNTAVRYGVGVGREGFAWNGVAMVGRTAEWPDWVPPKEMRMRQPELPERIPGGPGNPLGARALYLYQGNRDTLYRIHGTAEPWTIGSNVSSGCVRLLNEEIADLYLRTPVSTRVVVL